MLRVKVELVPFGDESLARQIAEMVVANTGDNPYGGHSYEAWTAPDSHSGEPAKFGRLSSFDRSQSVWELLRLMLEAMRLEDHEPFMDEQSISQRLLKRLGGKKNE